MKYLKTWGIALVIAATVIIVVQFFLIKIYVFNGSSMEGSIKPGEYVFINKISKIKRFNIVAFKNPSTKDVDIKRIVALRGDTLKITNTKLYINNKKLVIKKQINSYRIEAYSQKADSALRTFSFIKPDNAGINIFEQNLTSSQKKKLTETNLINCKPLVLENSIFRENIFPYSKKTGWNKDNFGTVIIPKRGVVVRLSAKNIDIYKQIIKDYENNSLQIKNRGIFINGMKTDKYQFKQDYCFVLNDNRTEIDDSRSFGFLPFKMIIGKKLF